VVDLHDMFHPQNIKHYSHTYTENEQTVRTLWLKRIHMLNIVGRNQLQFTTETIKWASFHDCRQQHKLKINIFKTNLLNTMWKSKYNITNIKITFILTKHCTDCTSYTDCTGKNIWSNQLTKPNLTWCPHISPNSISPNFILRLLTVNRFTS